jgi:hypothetical protein
MTYNHLFLLPCPELIYTELVECVDGLILSFSRRHCRWFSHLAVSGLLTD